MSVRSLERLVKAATGRPPAYWRGLARVRAAASNIDAAVPLSALAADHGYADQAHMTRAFRQWFGTSPARLRADPVLRATVAASGYGQPAGITGVHSSTRKPSGSET